ncbi:hypothetical protein N9954_08605 [Maribacter sp.]|nr:hypothetical protein [Maribacter sp.]
MKRGVYLLTTLLCTGFIFLSSCKKDDEAVTVNPPASTLPPDYVALKTLYDANSGNTLNWDIDDTTMANWEGVTQQNGRVTTLFLAAKNLNTITSSVGDLDLLTSLTIAENSVSVLPAELGNLANLTQLFLNDNTLSNIPSEIGSLVKLTEMDLSGNALKSLPEGIGNLGELTRLQLEKNALESLPMEIMDLIKLTYLNISDNVLKELPTPADINGSGWQELVEIYAQNNVFTSLPPLGNSKKLEKVNWSFNRLSFVPPAFNDEEQHQALKELHLNDNQLEIVPSELGGLINATILDLTNNKLIGLPTQVCNLETDYGTELRKDSTVDCVDVSDDYQALVLLYNANPNNTLGWNLSDSTMGNWEGVSLSSDGSRVTNLNLGAKNLDSIPPVIGTLAALDGLSLNVNNIASLPNEINQLKSVSDMDISGNMLSEIPEEIKEMNSLWFLDLGSNQLSEYPRALTAMTLFTLDLQDNQISEIPAEIGTLISLTELRLGSNLLTTLPADIGNLVALQILGLTGMNIASLPDEVCALVDADTTIELDDPTICTGGTPPASEYDALRELAENNGNQMGWDFADTDMLTWDGVTITGGRVSSIVLWSENISTIPESIGNLEELVSFDLLGNKLKTLPAAFGNLNKLEILNLEGNEFDQLPAAIGELESLQVLNLENNLLEQLPNEITNLSNLRELYLNLSGGFFGQGGLLSLPDDIGNLQSLEYLDLSDNRLENLPATFGNLTSLKTLILTNNAIAVLDANQVDIGGLTALEELNVANNGIEVLPDVITNLTQLKTLTLSKNELDDLPANMGNLANLMSLSVDENLLPSISPSSTMWQLNKLETLNLAQNLMGEIPEEISGLTNLGTLILRDNNLGALPTSIGSFSKMTYLMLSRNAILNIAPGTIGNLMTLEELYLDSNQIAAIPEDFSNLENLTRLDIRGNAFDEIPDVVCDLMDEREEELGFGFFAFSRDATVCDD